MQKLKLSYVSIGLLLMFFVTAEPTAAQKKEESKSFNAQKLSQYLDKLYQHDKMMATVVIDSAGSEVYEKSTGFLRPGGKPEANDQTRHRIGSVTKTFTAVMVFQLIEEEKLSLSTRLSEYYPEIPNADHITVENMLYHQSGLFNITEAKNYAQWMVKRQTHQ